jgi:hypothetical protein
MVAVDRVKACSQERAGRPSVYWTRLSGRRARRNRPCCAQKYVTNLSGVAVIPTAVSYRAEAEQLVFLASTVVSEQLDSYCSTVVLPVRGT